MPKLRAIDLFCGIGGFHYGAVRNNVDVVFASEIDKFAVKQYALNHGLEPHGDITKVDTKDIPDHDILMGGFPCIVGSAKVITSRGRKPLSSIVVGDMVLGHDRQYHEVLRFMKQGVKPVIRIFYDFPLVRKYSFVDCTPEHRFLVMTPNYDGYEWVEAQNLKTGDLLVGSFGIRNITPVISVGKADKPSAVVYDIEVEGCHSFTANGCFVHNCQAFSLAGHRKGFEDTRGTLFFEIARILKDKNPRFFLLENVKGLLSHKSTITVEHVETDLYGQVIEHKKEKVIEKTFDVMTDILHELGYRIKAKVLNSKDFGIPQNRERIFIVGFREEADYHRFQFPQGIPLERCVSDVLEDADFRKYGVSMGKIQGILESGREGFYSVDSSVSRTLMACDYKDFKNLVSEDYVLSKKSEAVVRRREGKFTEIDPVISPTLLARYAGMGSGPFVRHVSPPMAPELVKVAQYGDKDSQYSRVYSAEGLSCTLSANGGGLGAKTGLYLINDPGAALRIRRLTPRECARLQGFPEEYRIDVSDSQAYKQFGNSVTVNVVESVIRKIIESVGGDGQE